MLEALYQKKAELENLIDSRNEEIVRLEAEVEGYEAKLGIVEEMIADELNKQPKTIEEAPIEEVKDETVVICCGTTTI
jgi:predicted nuclease with TOPRIM domain